MPIIYAVKSCCPSPVIELIAAMKRQDVVSANVLGTPKLKLFEIV